MENSRWYSRALFLLMLPYFFLATPLALFAQSDVTNRLELVKYQVWYNKKNKTSYFDASIRNVSTYSLTGPFRVVVAGISPSQLTLVNPDGYTSDGKPYFDYATTGSSLLPGEATAVKKWVVNNPSQLRFSISLQKILSLANTIPQANAGDDAAYTLSPGQTSMTVNLNGSGSNDPDGTIATYRWSGSPDPGDVAQPTVTLTPGTYTFTLVVVDNGGAESSPDMVTITVNEPPNTPPTANAGQNATYTLPSGQSSMNITLNGSASTDSDGTILSYTWNGNPDPQDLAQSVVSLTAGTYTFTLVVTDNDNAQSNPASVTITVRPAVATVERPPVVSVSPRSYTISEGQTLTFPVTGSDPDGQVVTLSAQPKTENSTFVMTPGTQATGTFTFTPRSHQQGIHVVAFRARDTKGLSDTKAVEIRVTNVNQTPAISVPSTMAVDEGDILTIPIQASDPDNDILTLTVDGLPQANAIFIPATSSITFTPDYNQAGDYEIICRASDSEFTAQARVLVSVYDVPTGGTGHARELILNVNPVESPTFLGSSRITGTVNPTGNEPVPARMTSALITSMTPATAGQGQALDVELVSNISQQYTAHFVQGVSQASFGEGITIRGITVVSPTQVRVSLSIAPNAAIGGRTVQVTTGTETALCVVAFNVTKGQAGITGVLTDPGNGAPIAGAVVSIQGTNSTTTTNADGSFSFSSVPTGSYNLIFNALDHELIFREVTATTGITTDLGEVDTPTTVYTSGSTPSVSIQSVLGRGIGDTVGHKNKEDVKQAIRDTLLLIGGNEAGLLDVYGNQLNATARDGVGYYSLTDKGVDILADQMMRGDSVSLEEILFFMNFAFVRTQGGPATLDEWMNGLQAAVNAAWADPANPDSAYAIVMFGKGRTFLADPPQLSPFTRLTPLQAHIFTTSFLTYIFTMNDPTWGSPSRFWRINENVGRVSHLSSLLNAGCMSYSSFLIGVATMPTLTRVAMAGRLAIDLMGLFSVSNLDAYIPVEPVIISAQAEPAANNWEKVVITFNRSTSDNGSRIGHLYSLWRFDSANSTRTLIKTVSAGKLGSSMRAVIEDPNPHAGTYYYALTITRLACNEDSIPRHDLETAAPFWQSYQYNLTDAWTLFRTTHQLVSNYSNPMAVTVGDPAARVAISELEVDTKGDVYYLTGDKQIINKVTDQGTGVWMSFANTNFAAPGADGLAIDSKGNLYTENSATDMRFGGRIFKFTNPGGEREFTGTLNYYSQLLLFAQPTDAGPMAMAPDDSLMIMDNLSREVKQVQVNATYDPYRRVGQIFARIPDEAVGHAFDMETDKIGNVYLLYMGLSTPPSAGISFGPSQYLNVPRSENDAKTGFIPSREDGLITEYGNTRVAVNVLVLDSQSQPVENVQVRFEADYGTFLSDIKMTNSEGIATGFLDVFFSNHSPGHSGVAVRAIVPSLGRTYSRAVSVTNNLQDVIDDYRISIPRGPLIENNSYYTTGQIAEVVGRIMGAAPAGPVYRFLGRAGTFFCSSIIGPGGFNNIHSVTSDEPKEFVCQKYQGKVLELLNTMREARPYMLNGLDYGPTMAATIMHKNTVIWDSRSPNRWTDGLFLDPWITQAPEVYDYNTVTMQWGNIPLASHPRPDSHGHPNEYPLTGSTYYPTTGGASYPQSPKPVTGIIVASQGPAKVEVIDSLGNRIGLDQGGNLNGEKDGAWYYRPLNKENVTAITMPDPQPCNLRIFADAAGLASVALLFQDGQEVRYSEFPVRSGGTATLNVNPNNRGQSIITDDGPVPPTTSAYQPAITVVSPVSARRGQTLDVTLTGSHTNFIQGVSQGIAAQGITVNSLTVTSQSSAVASITIGSDVNPGRYIISVLTNTEFAAPLVSLEVTPDE